MRKIKHALLPPPVKLFGFTYASFYLEKTTFPAFNAACALRAYSAATTRFGTLGDGGCVEEIGDGGGLFDDDGVVGVGRVEAGQLQQQNANVLFFVTATVYNGKGMLTEAQQVSDDTPRMLLCLLFFVVLIVR